MAEGNVPLIVGMTSIALGALLWWTFITLFVSRLRKYFNRRGLIMLNRLVGTILMVLGAVGIIRHGLNAHCRKLLVFPKLDNFKIANVSCIEHKSQKRSHPMNAELTGSTRIHIEKLQLFVVHYP